MTDAEKAHVAAEKLIAKTAASRLLILDFDHLEFRALTDLPPEISELTWLYALELSNTKISDISAITNLVNLTFIDFSRTKTSDLTPLQSMSQLETILADNTGISDLTPLSQMSQLRFLNLWNTSVDDLRPILKSLISARDEKPPRRDIFLTRTPALIGDEKLAEIYHLREDAERWDAIADYIETLPKWPELLPHQKAFNSPKTNLTPPAPDATAKITITDDKIDFDHSQITIKDLTDPIKAKIYARLPKAVDVLVKFGNRYPEVYDPSRALKDLISVPFEEADLLDIHLQIAAITDIIENNAAKTPAERLDPDCLTAANNVRRLGPPITLGNPEVDLFEKRNIEYAGLRRDATVIAAEQEIAAGMVAQPDLTTDRAHEKYKLVESVEAGGRIEGYRSAISRNTVIVLSTLLGATQAAVSGFAPGLAVAQVAEFLVLHKGAILSTAPVWGETGYFWAADLIRRAELILENLRNLEK